MELILHLLSLGSLLVFFSWFLIARFFGFNNPVMDFLGFVADFSPIVAVLIFPAIGAMLGLVCVRVFGIKLK